MFQFVFILVFCRRRFFLHSFSFTPLCIYRLCVNLVSYNRWIMNIYTYFICMIQLQIVKLVKISKNFHNKTNVICNRNMGKITKRISFFCSCLLKFLLLLLLPAFALYLLVIDNKNNYYFRRNIEKTTIKRRKKKFKILSTEE